MYDILQLNEMLVPELLDIAEQLKINNAKKLGKQELVYKILEHLAANPGKEIVRSSRKPWFESSFSFGKTQSGQIAK